MWLDSEVCRGGSVMCQTPVSLQLMISGPASVSATSHSFSLVNFDASRNVVDEL